MEFALIEEIALHLKHVKTNFAKTAKDRFPPDKLLITHALGISSMLIKPPLCWRG